MMRCPYCLEDIEFGQASCPRCWEPLEPSAERDLATDEEIQVTRELRQAALNARNALTHGLVSLPCALAWCGPILGVAAIYYGWASIQCTRRHGVEPYGQAIAGIVLGILGCLLVVVFIAVRAAGNGLFP